MNDPGEGPPWRGIRESLPESHGDERAAASQSDDLRVFKGLLIGVPVSFLLWCGLIALVRVLA